MMYSKSNEGFSLIEAVIAVAIIGMVLTPMFVLETNVFNSVARNAERFHRLIFAKDFLYMAQREEPIASKDYKLERKENNPLSMVRYALAPVAKNSSLSRVKRLFKQQVVASGLERTSPEATIIHFVFKPEPMPS